MCVCVTIYLYTHTRARAHTYTHKVSIKSGNMIFVPQIKYISDNIMHIHLSFQTLWTSCISIAIVIFIPTFRIESWNKNNNLSLGICDFVKHGAFLEINSFHIVKS